MAKHVLTNNFFFLIPLRKFKIKLKHKKEIQNKQYITVDNSYTLLYTVY